MTEIAIHLDGVSISYSISYYVDPVFYQFNDDQNIEVFGMNQQALHIMVRMVIKFVISYHITSVQFKQSYILIAHIKALKMLKVMYPNSHFSTILSAKLLILEKRFVLSSLT